MPELPEVEALALDLKGRLADRAITRVDLAAFSALKTFDPPLASLHGHPRRGRHAARQVPRRGHLAGCTSCVHLARAGWIRWRDEVPDLPARPNSKSPLAARIVLDEDDEGRTNGLDVTEAGTKKSLAIYVVRDPLDVPGHRPARARTRWTTPSPSRCSARSSPTPVGPRSRACCATRAPSPASATPTPTSSCTPPGCPRSSPPTALSDAELQTLYDAIRTVLGDAVDRSARAGGERAEGREEVAPRGPRPDREKCPVCGDTVREVSFADSSLQYCPTCQTGGKPLADRRMSRLLK